MKYTDTKEYVPNRFSCRIKSARDLIIAHTHTQFVRLKNIKKFVFTWLIIGSVFIWHMYLPRSSSCTFFMCKFHVVSSAWDTDTLELCVMTWSCMACMAFVSAFTQPTCDKTSLSQTHSHALPAYAFGSECPKACT